MGKNLTVDLLKRRKTLMPLTATPDFLDENHDHRECVEAALTAAEELCRRRSRRLTALRRRVLELVWSGHRPVGAYAVLEMLQTEGRAAPPTVYRALEFLQEQGLVHRLASLNAYVGCIHPGRPHAGQFLICESCQTLVELDDRKVTAAIAGSAGAAGFQVSRQTVEILGRCPRCRKGEP
jgi:Fur family zinc uptake transcriptional regulator